uniref:NR LBD domain-containing protein n=1 Tax=Caenorhabditis tropicalis TaxID=1561998 RepID=A0A1I7TE69_9PELO
MVKQKNRKRKTGEAKMAPQAKKKTLETIELTQKDWMPVAAEKFFNNPNFNEIMKHMEILDASVELVGPFRKLKENSDVNGVELIMLDREQTDLPEMQTFMKCILGRYAFWRDTPSETNPVIVFADLKTIPELSVVGNKVEHAVHHFCEKYSKNQDNSKEALSALSKIFEMLGDSRMKDEITRTNKIRKINTVGGILGPGLYSDHPKGKLKYLPPANTLGESQLENLLRCLNNMKLPVQKEKVIKLIKPLLYSVMACNDEGYFGNGLELGHVIFLSNQKDILEDAMIVLVAAYRLLDREDFVKILQLTVELRN